MAITNSQYGGEALNSCNPFQTAPSPSVSPGPWIAITPDSHEGPDLDKNGKTIAHMKVGG